VPLAKTDGPIQLVALVFCIFHLHPDLLRSFRRLLSRLVHSQMPSLKWLHLAKRGTQFNYYFYCEYLKSMLKTFVVFPLYCKYIKSKPDPSFAANLATCPLPTGYVGSGSPSLLQSWGGQRPGSLSQTQWASDLGGDTSFLGRVWLPEIICPTVHFMAGQTG